jgi:hypothetical protein
LPDEEPAPSLPKGPRAIITAPASTARNGSKPIFEEEEEAEDGAEEVKDESRDEDQDEADDEDAVAAAAPAQPAAVKPDAAPAKKVPAPVKHITTEEARMQVQGVVRNWLLETMAAKGEAKPPS